MQRCNDWEHQYVYDDEHQYSGKCSKCKIRFKMYWNDIRGTTLQFYRDDEE